MKLTKIRVLGFILVAAGLVLIGYLLVRHDVVDPLIALVNKNTPTPLFLLLFAVLPLFGFPVSVFLILLGIKFGPVLGVALMLAVMPVHMIISFGLARLVGGRLQSLLSRWNYTIPQIPSDKQIRFSFVVASLPVAPYAVKNFLLPLAGIPFRLYLGMNWACQAVLATPGVILGGSIAHLDPMMFGAAVTGLVAMYLLVSWIEKRYGDQEELKKKDNKTKG